MSHRLTVAITVQNSLTHLLLSRSQNPLIKAVLPSIREAHPRALLTLLEGLALWHQTRLCVVLCADAQGRLNGLDRLYDCLIRENNRLYYDVGVAMLPESTRDDSSENQVFRALQTIGAREVTP